jgi:hypothetical protein
MRMRFWAMGNTKTRVASHEIPNPFAVSVIRRPNT